MRSRPLNPSLLVQYRAPAPIRIEAIYTLEEFERLWPEIFFIDDAVLAHDEGLNSSVPVLCRRSHQGEAANHHALDDVIQLAQRRGRPLTFQDFEEVTVIRFGAAAVALAIAAATFSPIGPSQVPSAFFQARPSCLPAELMILCAYWFTS